MLYAIGNLKKNFDEVIKRTLDKVISLMDTFDKVMDAHFFDQLFWYLTKWYSTYRPFPIKFDQLSENDSIIGI